MKQSPDGHGPAPLPGRFPLPRKALASIKGVAAGVRGESLPREFLRALKKALRKVGPEAVADYPKIYAPLRQSCTGEVKAGSLVEELERTGEVLEAITRDNPTFAATVPIVLERRGAKQPELIGSGVLVRIVHRTFLLTAAHVTDSQSDGALMIPGRQGFMPANGYFSSMRMPTSGRRLDDKLDVAYFCMDNDCVNDLHPSCRVLERQDVSLEAVPRLHADDTFAGYPWRRSRASKRAVETHFTTFTGAEAAQREYDALALNRSRHIVMQFDRKRMFSQMLGRHPCIQEGE